MDGGWMLTVAAVYQLVWKYFRAVLAGVAMRPSVHSRGRSACGGGNGRPLSTLHVDLGLGGAHYLIKPKVIVF